MGALTHFHAHIYFEDGQFEQARKLCQQLSGNPDVIVGQIHRKPVGPHPRPMFQVAFSSDEFAALVPWLMINRGSLDVLVHGDSGNDYMDHTQHTLWLGKELILNLSVLCSSISDSS